MTLAEAKKLKWGTILQPTRRQRDLGRGWGMRDAIYLGINRSGDNMAVVLKGRKTISYWSPVFWKPKAEVI